jgi:hypothetical protein
MDLVEALADHREKLSQLAEQLTYAQQERAAVEERIRTLEHQLRELEQEEQILRRVAVRYDIEPPRDGPLPREVEEWQQLTRTDAIMRVLKEAGRPMSPADIAQVLAEKGRDDSGHYVSAGLAYLKDSHRAHAEGRGQWVVLVEVKDSDQGESSDDREPASKDAT